MNINQITERRKNIKFWTAVQLDNLSHDKNFLSVVFFSFEKVLIRSNYMNIIRNNTTYTFTLESRSQLCRPCL